MLARTSYLRLHRLALALLVATLCTNAAPTGHLLPPVVDTWVVEHGFVAPDGVPKLVPLVNGSFPGPVLRGRAGQRVLLTVENRLPTESTTIHWHGIKQTGSPMYDGVPGVSECGIRPGERLTYNFTLDGPGTLWWHSHSGLQKSSLFGALIVDGDEHDVQPYADERTLLLSDWYHASSTEMLAGLYARPFRWVGDPQSLLLNGVGELVCNGVFGSPADRAECEAKRVYYNVSDAAPGPFRLDVQYDTWYRLRIVGAASLSLINVGIEAHELRVVEVETTLLQPYDTGFLDVGPGQSYSVLIRTKSRQEVERLTNGTGMFWITLNVRHRNTSPVGRAVLAYPSAQRDRKYPIRPPPASPGTQDVAWSLAEARKQRALRQTPLPPASRRVMMLGTQNRQGSGGIVWSVNNISFATPRTPVLHVLKFGLDDEVARYVSREWPATEFNYSRTLAESGLDETSESGTFVMKVRKDEVVDFVFQNTVALNGMLEIHPWHLHLHNFWVLRYGDSNTVETYEDRLSYAQKVDAVSRNTFNLYPNAWVAIRVKFDNAGVAPFHCHILPHFMIGMGFAIQIGEPHEMAEIPQDTDLCGSLSRFSGSSKSNSSSETFMHVL